MNTENLNLTMVEKSRSSITNSHDLQVYDFKMFSNCIALLENLNNEIKDLVRDTSICECVKNYEYRTLKKEYNELDEIVSPIMKVCYKGYKAYCKHCGISPVLLDYKD